MLVVPQHDVVMGTVLLNEVALQDEGLQLAVHQHIIEAFDMLHHGVHLGLPRVPAAEILPDPVFQGNGLPYIDHRPLGILHQVYARMIRQRCNQVFQLLLQFVLLLAHSPQRLQPCGH